MAKKAPAKKATGPKQTILSLFDEEKELEKRLANIRVQTAAFKTLNTDRETVQGLFETLGTISLPDEVDEVETLKTGIDEAKEAIRETYNTLFPAPAKKRGRKKGTTSTKTSDEPQGKRLATPINKALKAQIKINGHPMNDEGILNAPNVVAYKQKYGVTDKELRAELDRMVQTGKLDKMMDGFYHLK